MTTSRSVTVAEFTIKEVVIPIKGISPLITHAWSQKSIKMIEDKQQGVLKIKNMIFVILKRNMKQVNMLVH